MANSSDRDAPGPKPNNKPSSGSYLLVFKKESSSIVPLPVEGEVTIGSGDSATVHLPVPDGLAEHVRVVMQDGEATLRSLARCDSILVNGDPLGDSRALTSGDEITVAGLTIAFRQHEHADVRREVLDMSQFRRRLREELERFSRNQHPFAILALHLGDIPPHRARLVPETVASCVRVVDKVAWDGASEIVVLLPETPDLPSVPSSRLLEAVRAIAPDVKAGLAVCPSDGRTADALITGARNAARHSRTAQVASVASSATCFRLGDQNILAVDPMMKSLFALVHRLASSDLPVLITGETGVGKDLVALALHAWSSRSEKRLVAINCAAVTDTLLESELFGHERGAFTGAVAAKLGLLESAAGGTLFLDEVGECSPQAQAKLLRAIETKRFSRLGSVIERAVDVRIVSATNRVLDEEVAARRFRQDLYFRLSAALVIVPPLRDRKLDIPVLARTFLEDACGQLGRPVMSISPAVMQRLSLHAWPGNVRELKNVMGYCAATVQDASLLAEHLPDKVGGSLTQWMSRVKADTGPGELDESGLASDRQWFGRGPLRNLYDEIRQLEEARIRQALTQADGVRIKAAQLISMPLRTLVTKIKEYQIAFPQNARRQRTGEDD